MVGTLDSHAKDPGSSPGQSATQSTQLWMSTPMSVEVKTARERSGYPPSLAEAKKIEGANTSIPDGPFSSGYGFFTYLQIKY